MILSNNLNIEFRDKGRVGITAVLLDCRKGVDQADGDFIHVRA